MAAEPQFAMNLRLGLWRKGIPSAHWSGQVAAWAGVSEERAEQLLRGEGAPIGSSEIDRIASGIEQSADELVHGDLLAEVDILKENLRSLLSTLPHGGQLEFAKAISVDPTTVSRWATGKFPPRRAPNLAAIRRYFHLPSFVDLNSTPLFLDMDPIGNLAKRQSLHDQLDGLSADELDALFPALRKLLAKRQ